MKLGSSKERPLLTAGILTVGLAAPVSEATGLCIQMPLDQPKSARRRRLKFNHHFSFVFLFYGTVFETREFKKSVCVFQEGFLLQAQRLQSLKPQVCAFSFMFVYAVYRTRLPNAGGA